MHLSRLLGVQIHKSSAHSVCRDFPWDTTANQVQLNRYKKNNSVDNLINVTRAVRVNVAECICDIQEAPRHHHHLPPSQNQCMRRGYFKNIRSINSHQLVKSYIVAVSSQSIINMSNPHLR